MESQLFSGTPEKKQFFAGKVVFSSGKINCSLRNPESIKDFKVAVHFPMEIPNKTSWELGWETPNLYQLGIRIHLIGTQS